MRSLLQDLVQLGIGVELSNRSIDSTVGSETTQGKALATSALYLKRTSHN